MTAVLRPTPTVPYRAGDPEPVPEGLTLDRYVTLSKEAVSMDVSGECYVCGSILVHLSAPLSTSEAFWATCRNQVATAVASTLQSPEVLGSSVEARAPKHISVDSSTW
jgi:hypothetical protein